MHFYGLSILSGTDISQLKTTYIYRQIAVDAGVFFYTEGNFAIGFHFQGDFSNYAFDPYTLFLNQHKAYVPSDLEGTFAQFNVGFTFVYSFSTKKPKTE